MRPEDLPPEPEEPTARDFIICGASRTGTTLLTAALFQPPRVFTVMEPWDGMRLPPAELFRSLREEMSGGTLTRGRLDLSALQSRGQVIWHKEGTQPVQVAPAETFWLGVKWPIFWRYLGLLPNTRFLVCVRDPIDVIRSYEKVGGRLASGVDYNTPFNDEMNRYLTEATGDPLERRILLYEYVNSHIADHAADPNVLLVRYERWFGEANELLSEISTFLGIALEHPTLPLVRPHKGRPADSLVDAVRSLAPSAGRLGYRAPT